MSKPYLKNEEKTAWQQADCFGFEAFDYTNASMRYDYTIGMHSHNFYEVNIILQGRGQHCIGSHNCPVERGSVFVIPPNIRHGYGDTEALDVYHILLSDAFMNRYEAELNALPGYTLLFSCAQFLTQENARPLFLKLSTDQLAELEPLLQFSLHNTGEGVHIVSTALCLTVVGLLCRYMVRYSTLAGLPQQQNYLSAIIAGIEYIHQNYQEKLTVEQLAQVCHLSRSTLLRYFQSLCRCSPSVYLCNYRVKKAKELMLGTQLSLSQIAELCGFYDQAHFSKCFLAQEGVSPRHFRQTHLG